MMLFLAGLVCSSYVTAAYAALDPRLVGTWSTKSKEVITGPGFYDPIRDRFIEPANTGISYSFTADGYFEEAHYRALSNPSAPACVAGFMLFQHGTYSVEADGSLILTPIAVDGRQLISNPCKGKNSEYFRFNQTETFKRFEPQTDRFHNVRRLNLYKHDGSPMNPMFLVHEPPQMLPTQTLNPVVTATPTGRRAKRSFFYGNDHPLTHDKRSFSEPTGLRKPENWLWAGIIMTASGGAAFLYSAGFWLR
ncbi:Reversal of tor2 lethality [Ophidiomyces ophidiicola]|nr:Reversal of tor2 lethality [Ophidiomyces ophidiicola]KAI1920002.1 Reversal of tor2 lethality [Ophidiomyces ophidiicola]KAI1927339.1 Reversal of tor2 lethality [Ophidiomyces ophidiicola]KAI1948975.1 Reversal of tor2 lethality [Ophidiomyces ophidiicola]KAI1980094.1 Reversal of tor2 lethality [Ophidiomyces ophidiicola]